MNLRVTVTHKRGEGWQAVVYDTDGRAVFTGALHDQRRDAMMEALRWCKVNRPRMPPIIA